MEITWYGAGCLRLRGREGSVAADAFRSVVGPTGRGLTADIATYSHPEPAEKTSGKRGRGTSPSSNGSRPPVPAQVVRPGSLEAAFPLERPGEYEVRSVLITGVRTYRDEEQGAARGENVSFVYELDGLHTVHLGDIGHLLDEGQLEEIGSVDVVCVPVGGALAPAKAAELVAQLDAHLVVPLVMSESDSAGQAELGRFLHEMGASETTPQPKLTVTISSIPSESTVVVLDSRGKA
jgi:Beta-lactamase superfamily domain